MAAEPEAKKAGEKSSRDSLKPGSILQHRYKIVASGYQGRNFGAYPAEDLKTNGKLTLKVLQCEADETEKALKQFRSEYESLKSLQHEALPQLFDLIEDRGNYFMVLNRIEAKSLQELIDSGQRPEAARLVRWLYELMDVLNYLHKQEPPIIHRDLQPANIMIAPDNHLKLLDFGIAKIVDRPELRTVYGKSGNPVYAPIEQFSLKRSDPRMDIFSAGASFYHALGGQPPPPASERVLKMVPLIDLHSVNPSVSARCNDLIHSMMAIKPQERPPDARAVQKGLLEVDPNLQGSAIGPVLSPAPAPEPPPPPPPAPEPAPPAPPPEEAFAARPTVPMSAPAEEAFAARPTVPMNPPPAPAPPPPAPVTGPPSPFPPPMPPAHPGPGPGSGVPTYTAIPVSFITGGGSMVSPHFGQRVGMACIAALIFIGCSLAGFISLNHLHDATSYPSDVRALILDSDYLGAWHATALGGAGSGAARAGLLTLFTFMAASALSLLTTFYLLISALMGRHPE